MTPLLPLLPLLLALTRAAWPDEAFCADLRSRTRDMFGDVQPDATPLDRDLWLGNVCAAVDYKFLAQYNITSVVNMAVEWTELCNHGLGQVGRYCFALDDSVAIDTATAARLIGEAANHVSWAREAGRSVLVHCNMGVSRSTAVVLRHLMDREPALMYSEALARVRRLRTIAQPNSLFESLLDTVEERKRRWKAKFEL